MTSPTLVYDGDCGFCTRCVRVVERRMHLDARITTWQDADLPAFGITTEQAKEKLQWVADDGRVSAGHAAVGRLLLRAGGLWRVPGRIVLTPPFSLVAAKVYDLVAANRQRLPGGTPACALPPPERPGAGR